MATSLSSVDGIGRQQESMLFPTLSFASTKYCKSIGGLGFVRSMIESSAGISVEGTSQGEGTMFASASSMPDS